MERLQALCDKHGYTLTLSTDYSCVTVTGPQYMDCLSMQNTRALNLLLAEASLRARTSDWEAVLLLGQLRDFVTLALLPKHTGLVRAYDPRRVDYYRDGQCIMQVA